MSHRDESDDEMRLVYENYLKLDSKWIYFMLKKVDDFLLFRPYIGIWEVLVCRIDKKAAVISCNGLYLVHYVWIHCINKNITVLGSPQVLMKGFIDFFLQDTFPISARKRSQILFYKKYSMHTHILFLLIKGCQLFRICMCDMTYSR